jgi:pyruvate/2-oxoglutarate dehydrogenase complex dihydrolipoamide dehydrogenase (E3) component
MKRYLDWIISKTRHAPLEVRLSTEATTRSIKAAKPDVLIVAVGAEPLIPEIPGVKKPHVVWVGDVGLAKVKIGEGVVIAGAGMTGCETALHLAQQGKKVTIIDMIAESEIAQDLTFINRDALLGLLHDHGVEFKTEVKLEEITDKGAIVIDKQWNRVEIPADTVVLSLGLKARCETVKALQGLAREVYVVGDCANPRNLMAAVHDAFNVAVEL